MIISLYLFEIQKNMKDIIVSTIIGFYICKRKFVSISFFDVLLPPQILSVIEGVSFQGGPAVREIITFWINVNEICTMFENLLLIR